MKDFETFKKEILRRAKVADACTDGYSRALKSENFADLMQVIKDNFEWCCYGNVVDENIINDYKKDFNDNGIYCNESRDSGYLLVTDNVEKIVGDCVADVSGNAVIKVVYGNAVIDYVCDNAVIERVSGNAVIEDVSDNAVIDYVCDNAVIDYVSGNAKIIKDFR